MRRHMQLVVFLHVVRSATITASKLSVQFVTLGVFPTTGPIVKLGATHFADIRPTALWLLKCIPILRPSWFSF